MVFVMYGAVLLIVFIAVVVAARKDTRLASNGRRHKIGIGVLSMDRAIAVWKHRTLWIGSLLS
jgi:hypothetical protein